MAKVLLTESSLDAIAEAIRDKLGVETEYKPREMAAAILSIPTGIKEIYEAYPVGSTEYASDWLSDESGGTALTPSRSILYVVVSGTHANEVYRWNGSVYVLVSATSSMTALTAAEIHAITGESGTYYPDGDGVGY